MTFRAPGGVLAHLLEGAREDCAARKRQRPGLPNELARQGGQKLNGRFRSALERMAALGFPLICEVKRASPSVGEIQRARAADEQALAYVAGGAACVSVLTEGRRFGGTLEDLRSVRARVDVPLLRKDFIVDPYMVFEAAEAGADCILLIATALPESQLAELAHCARELGLDVLLELVHERELPAVEAVQTPLLGVNARDLESLEMDATRFERLVPALRGPGRLLVAESGVKRPEDVTRLARAGASAALVGEWLMRAEDPTAAVRSLFSAPVERNSP